MKDSSSSGSSGSGSGSGKKTARSWSRRGCFHSLRALPFPRGGSVTLFVLRGSSCRGAHLYLACGLLPTGWWHEAGIGSRIGFGMDWYGDGDGDRRAELGAVSDIV